MKKSIFIIAEAGVNHNGYLDLAKKLVDAATQAGADAVKFQSFTADHLVSKNAPKADYQTHSTSPIESHNEMIKRLELDVQAHKELVVYCCEKGINFLSSPFDLENIDLLDSLGLEIFKIPSGEITNLPYLRKIGSLNRKIIFSTGMADLGEIEDALDVLEKAGTSRTNITILHVNLRAMMTISAAFPGVEVGYSDHTMGIEVSIAAAALGATVIEKHLTLDKTMDGPDHRASSEPDEFNAMVSAIRNIEKAMGSGIKKASPSELKNLSIARKSIVAAKNITKGEILTPENISAKRPGTGISPMCWDEIISQVAKKNYHKDDLI